MATYSSIRFRTSSGGIFSAIIDSAIATKVSANSSDTRFVFLTNQFDLPALTIAQLYKARWQVELFFKWIKQHLRIKAFYGTSENAVKTQLWIAVCVYVLVAIIKKELHLAKPLHYSTSFQRDPF